MAHPLAAIAETGAKPMEKTVALRAGNPDQTSGMMWAQSAIALCMSTASAWTSLAHQLFGLNIEQREAALKAWKAWKTEKTKAFKAGEEQTPAMDEKTFKRIMATATVRLSHMSTIANAITAGMDYAALAAFYRVEESECANMSIDTIYQLAKSYSKSKAGRAPDDFLTKLGKFLDNTAETEQVDEYNAIAALYAKLSQTTMAEQARF